MHEHAVPLSLVLKWVLFTTYSVILLYVILEASYLNAKEAGDSGGERR